MNTPSKKEYNAITEFKNILSTKEIKIWLYTMPVKDLIKKHNENYNIVQMLKRLNRDNKIIEFNEYIIASFEEIKDWGDVKYIKSEYRNIDTNVLTEKRILERLLLEDIKVNINTLVYENEKNSNSIYIRNPILDKENLTVKRKMNFDVNIEDNGDIIVGFTLRHGFDYKNTIEVDLRHNNIYSGEKVKDFYNNSNYRFKGIADFTISDKNEYMQYSIIDYYNEKGLNYIVEKLDPKTRAVLVEANNKQIFPYIPNRLKKVCDFGNLSGKLIKESNKYTKLNAQDKMKSSIALAIDILNKSRYIKLDKHNMIIENLGYKKNVLKKPKFIFGGGFSHSSVLYGLPQFGSYENNEIEISYFIDPEITKDENNFKAVKVFTKELESFSKNLGINIKRISTHINFNSINTTNKDLFESDIRDIVESYKNPSIVIMKDSNCEKYYTLMKKIFGNKNCIATQFVNSSTLNYNDKSKQSVLLNILLGIYGKSGIQPWILQDPLNADCFVGLDVSRENKLNTAGIIQIVGKDGRILRSKSVTSSQSGEKINIETIKEIFHDVNSSYKKMYGKSPKHIVFHRDGISREELDLLKETSSNLGIKFDYVEITKNVQRRIATFDTEEKKWKTEIGAYYSKDNKAYIVTTSPFEFLGMAQPIRVKKVYGEQDIESIVEDVYKLSFMHIGSVLKARLPVTTHYADLSSTFGNRELMPSNIDSNCLHFI